MSNATASFREALRRGEFAITCEFVPGRGKNGVSVDAALEFAREVSASGLRVHAVSLTDNPGGNPAIMPEALAPEIRDLGLETLVHFSCRDLNRNAVESRIMALARAGIHNLLVITGDYPASGFEGHAAPVFDLDAVQAIKYVKAMNAGLEVPGFGKAFPSRLPPTEFLVGAAVSPFKLSEAELMPQFFKLDKKIAAGADFVVTQLGYDMRRFLEIKRYMTLRHPGVPIVGNVYVLSAGAARAMHAGKVPGCVVPDALMETLAMESKAPDKGKARRLERAAAMVAMFKGMGFNGAHIGGFALKTGDFRFIIERAAAIGNQWESFLPEALFAGPDEFYAFPAPLSYRPGETDADPVSSSPRKSSSPAYALVRGMHRALFDRRDAGCRAMTRYYRALDGHPRVGRVSHAAELAVKRLFFGCRDCGDCALPDMAYCCPQSGCAKQQRNGPCGGSIRGMCEVYPTEKPCVWTRVYERLRSVDRLAEMRETYVPPRANELAYTSGWANYFLGRDHGASDTRQPKTDIHHAATTPS